MAKKFCPKAKALVQMVDKESRNNGQHTSAKDCGHSAHAISVNHGGFSNGNRFYVRSCRKYRFFC